MKVVHLAVLSLSAELLLSGCESFNLRPPPVDQLVVGDTESQVVASAQAIMIKYGGLASDLSAERNWFNLPLLGSAATAAGALVFGGGAPQANILKGAGLGAATITATQTYLSPSDRMNAYARAADAVACIVDAGGILAQGQLVGTQPRQDLEDALASLQTALAEAAPFDAASGAGASQIGALKDAETAAKAARDAVTLDVSALNSSVPDTKNALRSVIAKVRNVVLTSRTIDFTATRDALVLSATQSAQAAAKKDQANAGVVSQPSAAGASAAFGNGHIAPSSVDQATSNLQDAVAIANRSLNYGFAQAKATLTGCPAKA